MDIKVNVSGLGEISSRFDSIANDIPQKLETAMRISARDVRDRARAEHRFTTRTGEAERSIDAVVNISGDSITGTVGTTRLITIYLHQGTRAHMIQPRNKRVLRWSDGNTFVFARRARNPGIKKDPFVYNALDAERGAIISRFDHAIENLLKG